MTATKNKSTQEITQKIEESYDQFQYHSYPFEYTSPENLSVVAKIFSATPPAFEKARILELGCAAGNNLLRFALDYPHSYSLGIDLSRQQIASGQKTIEGLGIKNIELKHLSIMDLDESYGKFDYILCHGVFSWVPDEVKEKILEISNKLLSPNGVVFISYNSLPGWNMNATIKDMMKYHTQFFIDHKTRVDQARNMLKFVHDAFEGNNSPYARFVQNTLDNLNAKRDDYILHEYLEEENQAFYLSDFVEKAYKHNLKYLGDTDLQRMYVGNMPKHIQEDLSKINDVIRTEQYMDFIRNAQFRCSLLVKKDVDVNYNVTDSAISSLNFIPLFRCTQTEVTKEDIETTKELKYVTNIGNNETNISTNSSYVKACFTAMLEDSNSFLTEHEITNIAKKYYSKDVTDEQIKEFNNILLKMIFAGYVKVRYTKPKSYLEISEKPRVTDLALYQIKHRLLPIPGKLNQFTVTNQLQQLFPIQDYLIPVFEAMDGSKTIAELQQIILDGLNNGSINAQNDSEKITDETLLKQIASDVLNQFLKSCKQNHVLIA